MVSTAVRALATLAAMATIGARAACECGYLDPTTKDLWTDAVITYFNETNAADQIVFHPEDYADRYGRDSAGYAGDGQQAWINSNRINEWEDDFSATWRSAVIPNNTYLAPNGAGLRLDVAPADTKNRISWGSQLQTRRRDIRYGSFRTMLNPPWGYQQGTDLDIEVAWNQSEQIRTAFFNTQRPQAAANIQYSYTSNSQSPTPVWFNQSSLNVGGRNGNGLEYRMDWLPHSVSFLNSGTNTTSNALVFTGKKTAPPVTGAPFSYKHWSNGSPTQSQGPPVNNPIGATVVYARLFFNSSLPDRESQFTQACASAGSSATCSTDDATLRDTTLRDTTLFSQVATQKQVQPHKKRHVPVYSIYGATISGGIFFLLTLHAVIRRSRSTRQKRAMFYAKYHADRAAAEEDKHSSQPTSAHTETATGQQRSPVSDWDVQTVDEVDKHVFDQAMEKWEHPDMLLEQEAIEGLDIDDSDSEEEEDLHAAEVWHFNKGESDSVYSGHTNASGYVLPHIHMSHTDLTRSGLTTPAISGTSTPVGFGTNHDLAGARTPISVHAPSLPSVRGFRTAAGLPVSANGSHDGLAGTTTPSGSGVQSVMSFHNDDGLGHPPAMPSIMPTVLLEDGTTAPVTWATPIADWTPAGGAQSKAHGQLAAPPAEVVAQDQQATAEFEPSSFWQRIKSHFVVSKGAGQTTSSGAARVEYLDGLRGFACFLVSFHHFLLIYYYGMTTQPPGTGEHYRFEYWLFKILGPIIANGGLNVGIFFVLSARVICNRYLFRGNLQHLAQLVLTRVPRLGVTVSAALILAYFLIEVEAFYWVARLPSRTFSIWSYYEDWTHIGAFLNALLSLWWMQPPSSTPFITHFSTGIIWSMLPVLQNTWTCVICALITREIKNPKKRYPFYSACILLSWWWNRFDYFFLTGLMLADLDVRFQYRQKAGHFGHAMAWFVFAIGATFTWLSFTGVLPDKNEWGIHPDFVTGQPNKWAGTEQAWYLPKATDGVFVISFFLLCDFSPPIRTLFQMRFWNVFGRNAFSLYLIHGMVFWSVGAVACLKMLAAGIPYWAAILLDLFLCYALLFVACELFTRTFDRWGITLSRSLWRAVTGGLGRRV